jgi:hypothetical protein
MTVFAVLVCAVWVASFWAAPYRRWHAVLGSVHRMGEVGLMDCTLYRITAAREVGPGRMDQPHLVEYDLNSNGLWVTNGIRWWPLGGRVVPAEGYVVTWIRLWPFATVLGVATAWLWRQHFVQRGLFRAGLCPCGYSRAGLAVDAPCPECGRNTGLSAGKGAGTRRRSAAVH